MSGLGQSDGCREGAQCQVYGTAGGADPLAVRRTPRTLYDPICDDNSIPLWLVPGDWTRGRAVAYVAEQEGRQFTEFRARRSWLRYEYLDFFSRGWSVEDGTLTPCDRGDERAESYWEVALV